jgi:uncharacterized protein YcbK (DUF882 family)
MILITPHFKLEEFACKDGTPYPHEWIEERLEPLANMLEVVRERAGGAIHIVSGFRSPTYNQALRKAGLQGEHSSTGVAEKSQHTEGRAADIACFGMTTDNLHSLIKTLWEDGVIPALGGLAKYPLHGFTHVDTLIKAPGKLRTW